MNRHQRRVASAQMTKCACGQTASLGQDDCTACRVERYEASEKQRALDACETVEDLRDFIALHLLP